MYASRVASANPTQGDGLMLDAIAAVFLGMTMSEDAEPRALATLVGVLILAVLDNGLTQLNVDSYLRQVLVGAVEVLLLGGAALPFLQGELHVRDVGAGPDEADEDAALVAGPAPVQHPAPGPVPALEAVFG